MTIRWLQNQVHPVVRPPSRTLASRERMRLTCCSQYYRQLLSLPVSQCAQPPHRRSRPQARQRLHRQGELLRAPACCPTGQRRRARHSKCLSKQASPCCPSSQPRGQVRHRIADPSSHHRPILQRPIQPRPPNRPRRLFSPSLPHNPTSRPPSLHRLIAHKKLSAVRTRSSLSPRVLPSKTTPQSMLLR